VILGIVAYLVSAGAAGGWLAKNVIEPVFGKGGPATATPGASVSATPAATRGELQSETATDRVEETITAGEISLYTLQVGAYTDESHANASAGAIAAMGGAGYIAYDGELYRVLAAGYLNESDAKDVQATLEQQSVTSAVFLLKSGSLEFKIGATPAQVEVIKACFTAVPAAALTLQQIVFDADRGENVDEDIKALAADVAEVYGNLEAAISPDDSAIQSLAAYMSEFCEKMNNIPLSTDVSAVEFSARLKYNLIGIVVDYSAFLKGISG
jgi:Sporulation related domain.